MDIRLLCRLTATLARFSYLVRFLSLVCRVVVMRRGVLGLVKVLCMSRIFRRWLDPRLICVMSWLLSRKGKMQQLHRCPGLGAQTLT